MGESYESYLASGTRQMMQYLSSSGADDAERQAVIEAFAGKLTEHIGDSEAVNDSEKIIYDTSIQYLDGQLSKVISNTKASCDDYEKALSYCKRITDLLQLYSTRAWNVPILKNQDIEVCKYTISQRMESTSIAVKVISEDKRIDSMLAEAQRNLDVKTCDLLLLLLNEFDADIITCKNKKISLPAINNKHPKKIAKRVASIRKISVQKEKLHQEMYELDTRIQTVVAMPKSVPDNWKNVIDCCQKQKPKIAECMNKQWPLPSIQFKSPDLLIEQFNLYLEMNNRDKVIYSSQGNLSRNRKYKKFVAACEEQCSYIKTCHENRWDIPALKVSNPEEILIFGKEQKAQHDRARKRRRKLILALLILVVISSIGIMRFIKTREGKIKIPFDASYVSGVDQNTIYRELKAAGFKKISKKEGDSGWLDSGEVISVTIDNSNVYNKDKYVDPAVSVVITCSSSDRIYVTDILNDWITKPYLDVEKILTDAGFTNIMINEVETAEKDQDQLSAGLELNGQKYTNEHCYLPKNAPITLSYYILKIGIGDTNTEFTGQNYEAVVKALKESGFTNVQTKEIATGWAEGNTVVGVTVNNTDNYSSSESFSPDVKIEVKYSSNDRVDITEKMKNWSSQNYDKVQTALKKAGMTNVTVTQTPTTSKSKNLMTASITINNTPYTSGSCFAQENAPIVIEYYWLSITVGQAASDFTLNAKDKYSEVVAELNDKGFSNITVFRNNSLINGLITKEGSVSSISINGKSDFSETDSFDYDAPVIIVVNTFKKSGCEDITEVWKG